MLLSLLIIDQTEHVEYGLKSRDACLLSNRVGSASAPSGEAWFIEVHGFLLHCLTPGQVRECKGRVDLCPVRSPSLP